MSSWPELSVVVGVRNGEARVATSLRSVLDQRDIDIELIVVDDGSQDKTFEVLSGLAAHDARMRVLRQDPQGLTRALIRGCAAARAPVVVRHDADDRSLSGRLVAQRGLLLSDDRLVFVSCWCRALGPRDETLWEARPPSDATLATQALKHAAAGPPAHGSVAFRRDAYLQAGGYRAEFYYGQDADLWLRLADVGGYAVVPRLLYEFQVDEQSISVVRSCTQLRYGQLAHACRDARAARQDEAPLLAEAQALSTASGAGRTEDGLAGAYFIGRCLLKRRDPRALGYLLRATRRNPRTLRTWLSLAQGLATAPLWALSGRRAVDRS